MVELRESAAEAVSQTPAKKKRSFRKWRGLLYITPWLIGFFVFQFGPLLASFGYSFTNYNMMSAPKFVGLKNYIQLFTADPEFVKSLTATLTYACISVPAKLIFALFVAYILNFKLKGVNFYRTVYYMPSILGGSIAISALWKLLFMKEGIINGLLSAINIGPVDWLGTPGTAMIVICLLQVWQFGSSMVLFLAALKQIPAELYEAAEIDGCSKVKQFFKITLPMITPIVFFNLVMQSINAFQDFTAAFIITNGGPLKSTYLIGMKLYDEGFRNFKMGYACAISWVLFAIILLFTLLVFRSSDAWVYYEDGGDF